jgi:hypothetical protein
VSFRRGGTASAAFISGKHERLAGEEERFRSRLSVFQVKRKREESLRVELDLEGAFPGTDAPLVHAFALCSRFAVVSEMRSKRVVLMHVAKQVVLADFDARVLFPASEHLEIESILVSHSGARVLLLAEGDHGSAHLCCVDPLTKTVVFSQALPHRVRCCSLSPDGSQAFVQLDTPESQIIRIDMNRGDRERLASLCRLEGPIGSKDVLRRVKTFLIG